MAVGARKDFLVAGAKRAVSEGADAHKTRTGILMGTPAFMAPEQAAGKMKNLTVAADVYSLGAILWEALTGRRLFQGSTPMATITVSQATLSPDFSVTPLMAAPLPLMATTVSSGRAWGLRYTRYSLL